MSKYVFPKYNFLEKRKKLKLLLAHIETNIPSFELRSKEDSMIFTILSKIFFFNKNIQTRFITTLYPHVYLPRLPYQSTFRDDASAIEILAHEYIHLKDRKKYGWLFNFAYLSPQIFALFAPLALLEPWWLLSLIALLPFPSPGRAWIEFRGYKTSLAVYYWLHGKKHDIDFIVKQFTGSGYYWMMPFEKYLVEKFEKEYRKVVSDDLSDELKELKEALQI